MKAVIIAGSHSDHEHVDAIAKLLVPIDVYYLSAHRNTHELLDVIKKYSNLPQVLFVAVAGLSNALSGVIAANTDHVVIACPPFKSTADYLADIHSTLRMPSGVPVLTVLGTGNCQLAIMRIMKSWGWDSEEINA